MISKLIIFFRWEPAHSVQTDCFFPEIITSKQIAKKFLMNPRFYDLKILRCDFFVLFFGVSGFESTISISWVLMLRSLVKSGQ